MAMTKILGIDPGRSKTGLALVGCDGKIIKLHIAMTDNIKQELVDFVGTEKLMLLVIGDGTNNEFIADEVKKIFPVLKVCKIGEAHSTEEARHLYWQENPPKGWRKLIPLGLQVPSEPLDAYAAVVQVRRWLKKNNV